MFKSFKKMAFLISALLLSLTTAQADQLQCSHISPIEKGFLAYHVLYKSYSPTLESRVIDQFIQKLDPTKIYLMQSDVDKIKDLLSGVYAKTEKQECGDILKAQQIYVDRVKERTEFAEKILGKKYKLAKDVDIILDPKKREFMKNKEEADNFHERYIHFQIANYLASDMKLNKAKKQLVRRYKRNLKTLKSLKPQDIYAYYLDSFAGALDPHSSFLSQDQREDFDIQMGLQLEGIGATLSSQDGYTVIENLIPGGSAASSGLLEPQDKIISVGQGSKGSMETVIDEQLRDVVRKIRGTKGTKVRLSILRKVSGKTKRFEVTLVRDKINLEDEAAQISYVDKVEGDKKKTIAVVELPSFYSSSRRGGRSSATDLRKLLKEARAKKVNGIVLDLSQNGGGSLDDAVRIAGLFIKTGNVVETQNATKSIDQMADDEPDVDWSGPLVILTSRLSASASEIVAGALQDYKRAVIVGGDHTFGKGSVQSVMPLPNQLGALKTTIGMFFVPGGESTQHRGVHADVTLPGPYSSDDVGEKSLDYSLPPKSLSPFISEEAYVSSGADAWVPLTKEVVNRLKAKSSARVEKNEDFQKIIKNLKKAEEEKNKPVKIAEILKDKEKAEQEVKEKKKKKLTSKAKKEEYLKRPDIQEATNVLMDLISLQQDQYLKMVSTTADSTEKKN